MRALKILGAVLGSTCLLGGLIYGLLYAYCYQTTLPIDGVVVDATTGKPVSKVFVMAMWHVSHANFVDNSGEVKGFGTVTDEVGRFHIPSRNVTTILGAFNLQLLTLRHPLYDFHEIQVYSRHDKYAVANVNEGRVQVTIPLSSLENRYSKVEDIALLARAIDDCGPEFYKAMRDQYGTRYDIVQIMGKLKELANRFPGVAKDKNFASQAYLRHQFRMKELQERY